MIAFASLLLLVAATGLAAEQDTTVLAKPLTIAPVTPRAPNGLDVFSRGDTDCSVDLTAADVTAQLVALNGGSACDNDDCDRDGDVDADDVECAARCLFGRCPVPPGAPHVTAIEAVSVPSVRPFSVVRITGKNFGDSSVHLNLRVGERQGEIIDLESPTELLALVPSSEAGPQELIVSAAEIESAPFPVEVEPAEPVGDADTLEDLVAEVLAVTDYILSLDTAALFGENAGVVVPLLESKRGELETLLQDLLDDPEFTPPFADALDRAIDVSGTPEMLRQALSQLQESGQGAQGPPPAATVQVARSIIAGGSSVSAGITVAAEAAAAEIGGAIVGSLALAEGMIILGGAVVVGTAAVVLSQQSPILTDVTPGVVSPGERIRITGSSLGTGILEFEPNLILVNDQGQEIPVTEAAEAGEDFLAFDIPDAVGVCGSLKALLRLPLLLGESQNALHLDVRPLLQDLAAEVVAPPAETTLAVTASGIVGCKAKSAIGYRASEGAESLKIENEVSRRFPDSVTYRLPLLVPGLFDVRVYMLARRITSLDTRQLTAQSSLTDLQVTCPQQIALDDTATCQIEHFSWRGGTASPEVMIEPENIADATPMEDSFLIHARRPGSASIKVAVRRDDGGLDRLIVEKQEDVVVEIVDEEKPTIQLESDSGTTVLPGGVIQVTAQATDDFAVQEIRLEATGPVQPGQESQTFDLCPFVFPEVTSRDCDAVFTVDVLASAAEPVVLTATAVDHSGNLSDPAELTFALLAGTIQGTVVDAETEVPIPGATIELIDSNDQLVDSITSGGGGFAFFNVAPGNYTLRASAAGHLAQMQAVTITADETADTVIALPPLSGVGKLNALVRRYDPNNRTPVEGATVALVNSDLVTITQGVTGDDGRVLIEGIPAGEYVWTAIAPGFARTATRLNVGTTGGTAGGTADLYPVNPSCQSDLSSFIVERGVSMFGNSISLLAGDLAELFDLPTGTQAVHPDAAVICVGGDPAGPTVDWHEPWAAEVLPSPPVNRVLFVLRGSTAPTLFDLRSTGAIVPPVTYGDTTQGTDEGPFRDGQLPDLEPGEPYGVTVDSSRLTLNFMLR